jgi:hypothetical protein
MQPLRRGEGKQTARFVAGIATRRGIMLAHEEPAYADGWREEVDATEPVLVEMDGRWLEKLDAVLDGLRGEALVE